MSCFPCFSSQRSKKSNTNRKEQLPVAHANNDPGNNKPKPPPDGKNKKDEVGTVDTANIRAHNYTFRELATATKNFRQECLVGEGGFGRVFKGTLQPSGKVVTVKQLDRNGTQGSKEFLVEVLMLSLLHHPNLLKLVGYCADGDQRLLVYEYMPFGSLEDRLLEITPDQKPLDWLTRMRIAAGAAEGLEYLHEKANPPIIYRDLKSSNILLSEEFNPVLSDFGLAKFGPVGNKTHLSPRLMGNDGYCAPEYERKGELTLKSDIYSFGVVLLELITGRRAIDATRPTEEQNLVTWAQPIFRDPKRFPEMADPLLKKEFPVRSLNQAVGVAAMCLQEEPSVRPLIGDVVAALSFLTMVVDDPVPSNPEPVPPEVKLSTEPEVQDSSDDDHDHSDHENGGLVVENGSDNESRDSSEQSDHEEEEEEESEDHQKLQKGGTKSVKWGSNSIHISKVESQDSVRSISRRSNDFGSQHDGSFNSSSMRNSYVDPDDKTIGSNSTFRLSSENRLYSWSYSNVTSEDGSFRSNVDHVNSMKSKDGSLGSNSGRRSDVGSEGESVNAFSGRISNVGSHDGSVGSNGRRVNNVGSEH